jgi:hypothetical protein
MAPVSVASLTGAWLDVCRTVAAVFQGRSFVLLAEDRYATVKPHFEPGALLNDQVQLGNGRAFNREAEARWRKEFSGLFVLTYLSESLRPPSSLGLEDSGDVWEVQPSRQKLTGQWSDSAQDWVDVSVPGVAGCYGTFFPTTGSKPESVMINGFDYFRNGCLLMTRFSEVVPDLRWTQSRPPAGPEVAFAPRADRD